MSCHPSLHGLVSNELIASMADRTEVDTPLSQDTDTVRQINHLGATSSIKDSHLDSLDC